MIFPSHQNSTPPNLEMSFPGISSTFIQRAQIRHIPKDEAFIYVQIGESGWLFPYLHQNGSPVMDGGKRFYRLRLDRPKGNQKYHQQHGTSPHAYLPPTTEIDPRMSTYLFIVEGEKKALSLAEAGMLVIGLGGFYSFKTDEQKLVPELAHFIETHSPQHIVFLGDKDVLFNYQFSHAAVTLQKMIEMRFPDMDANVYAAHVRWYAPGKGVDDCRHLIGADQFNESFYSNVITPPIPITNQRPGALALALLNSEFPTFEQRPASERDELKEQMFKLAAGMQNAPLEQDELIRQLTKFTDLKATLIKREIKTRSRQLQRPSQPETFVSESAINVNQQPGAFVRKVLEAVSPFTYFLNQRLCFECNGKFTALDDKGLVSFLDSPERLSFCTVDALGHKKAFHLTEKEGRIVNAALAQNRHLLREVRNAYRPPILLSTDDGTDLITGYNREHQIFAGKFQLPEITPYDAVVYLLGLLSDFHFETPGDRARAFALLLTPALLRGNFLGTGRTPFFFIQKDAAGAGGGTLARLVSEINFMHSLTSTPTSPQSAREDISMHLAAGRDYFCLDNISGSLLTQLPYLESILTESEQVARTLYTQQEVNPTRCVFVCTSNGARLSPDLADRSVRIALRKQPAGYQFRDWPGNLIEHAQKHQSGYLASVYSIISEWVKIGRPTGQRIAGLRFQQWEKICSWFCENLLQTPLLDGTHHQFQLEVSDPDAVVLRQIFLVLSQRGNFNFLSTNELLEIAASENLMPNTKPNEMKMGRILKRHFPNEGTFNFGQISINRKDIKDATTRYELSSTYAIIPRIIN